MPAYSEEQLGDTELWQVITYLRVSANEVPHHAPNMYDHRRAGCAESQLAGATSLKHDPAHVMTSGTPCLACHTNPTGGGGRTELGWSSMSNVGAITYEDVGLSPDETNMLVDGLLSIGLDIESKVHTSESNHRRVYQ